MMFTNKVATKEWVLSEKYTNVVKNRFYSTEFTMCGAWRWDGIHKHRHLVASHVFDENQIGIDFGGYLGPIGGYTTIIDIKCNNSLDDIEDDSLDYIFTSHTLEHVDDVILILEKMYKKLKDNGKIIILVPSWQKEVWRTGRDPNHNYTFKLYGTEFEPATCIDLILETVGFKLLIKEYCYKCNIFIYCEKKNA